jgi:hypothetical protein
METLNQMPVYGRLAMTDILQQSINQSINLTSLSAHARPVTANLKPELRIFPHSGFSFL